jgi:hypothetical protein
LQASQAEQQPEPQTAHTIVAALKTGGDVGMSQETWASRRQWRIEPIRQEYRTCGKPFHSRSESPIMLLGAELFFVEELEIRRIRTASPPQTNNPFQQASWAIQENALNPSANTWLYQPREWMPWSLLAAGTVIVIYTFTLPGRRREASSSPSA